MRYYYTRSNHSSYDGVVIDGNDRREDADAHADDATTFD